MNIRTFLKIPLNKKWIIFLIIAGIISLILSVTNGHQVIQTLFQDTIADYLGLLEKIANKLLRLAGSELFIADHKVNPVSNSTSIISSKYLLGKWFLFILFIILITPTNSFKKLKHIGFLVVFSIIGSILNISISVFCMYYAPDAVSAQYVGRTPYVLIMLFICLSWIWKNRTNILNSQIARKINLKILVNKKQSILIVFIVYALLGNLFLGLFNFYGWIDILLRVSAWLLMLLDYSAEVEKNLLIGENGSIIMIKGCLGFTSMLLFASVVYLTGRQNITKWLFIISGLIILNISNVIRFVLLFIHLQKHEGYSRTMDLHDIYNLVIYGIIFILWIIWFERFSDLRYHQKEKI